MVIELYDELPDSPDSDVAAELMFTQLKLDTTYRLIVTHDDTGTRSYFAVFKTPETVDDCKIVRHDKGPLTMLHGTDCTMVRQLRKDIQTGMQTLFQPCARRLAGGSFEVIEVTS